MDSTVIPIDDRGFLLGDGLFETVLFKQGEPVLWAEHLARLSRGCEAIGLPAPDPARLEQKARRVVAERRLETGRAAVRLTWTAGSGGRGLARPEPLAPRLAVSASAAKRADTPAVVALSAIRRNARSPTSRLKSLNYLDNVLARREAQGEGADEALMLNTAGHVASASAANIFWITDGQLYTSSLGCGVLDGVMRAAVIGAAPVEQVRANLDTLLKAEAAFLTSSLIGIRMIRVLAGRYLGPHQIIDTLGKKLAPLC
jgi:branched-chain amino acid aminotransferase/4-amino-4-deoxychorismate lyase